MNPGSRSRSRQIPLGKREPRFINVEKDAEPPPAFKRTLPPFYADESTQAGRAQAQALRDLDTDDAATIYIQLAAMPKHKVLHVYLCIAGEIKFRLNLAGYEPGGKRECFDGSQRDAKFWAICTGPVSRPPEPIKHRGFQGHRYTEELW